MIVVASLQASRQAIMLPVLGVVVAVMVVEAAAVLASTALCAGSGQMRWRRRGDWGGDGGGDDGGGGDGGGGDGGGGGGGDGGGGGGGGGGGDGGGGGGGVG